ncbi:uncharacterized protein At5g41620-like [Syzygium oleosum]|uniref:uncharacterized protein At5g41620-like n=1 Tax=Syzygium oleosum TaxID=219896 RepID=UPI0024B8AC0E|nr:uncharacterized protein At5g41620-like [Syzygium oleosum]
MKRGGKSGEEAAEKEENLGQKLRRGVILSKRCGGPSTPVRLEFFARGAIIASSGSNPSSPSASPSRRISARKLAAALWEFTHYLASSRMHHHNGNLGSIPLGLRRLRKDKDGGGGGGGGGFELSHFLADPSPSSPDQPESTSSLRRHVAASLMQHHRSIERNNRAIQPVSPASYGSSMEVTPYNPAVTPSSSLDFKRRVNEPHYSLKTSTELLKVLNRIWSLEEQHASNISLIKALKMELDHARVRIKELLRDQQADRHEIDALMKQISEDKLVRKSKEQDRIHAAVHSARDELEDERKLRKRSESLHRKLARELSDAKSSLSHALKELEKDGKSRKLLEDLCDEFAVGIRDYEHEVHSLKQRYDKDWAGGSERDRLILHISESWLDERMQMKLEEAQSGPAEKSSIVDKLSFEIETFLQAKRKDILKSIDNTLPRERRNSLESVPLNEVVSAPRDLGDEDDSDGSDSNCFELNRQTHGEFKAYEDQALQDPTYDKVETELTKKKRAPRGRRKAQNPSSVQAKSEKAGTTRDKRGDGSPVEVTTTHKLDNHEAMDEFSQERKNKSEVRSLTANSMLDDFIKSQLKLSSGGSVNPDVDFGEASCSNSAWRTQASPVRPWMVKQSSNDPDVSESSSKLPPVIKENTLKAKLMEARSKGQRSRLRASRGFS